MDEILNAYKKGKFKACLQLLSSLKETDDVVENLLLENCKLMCQSYIVVFEYDPAKIIEMQEEHYQFFEKVTSLGFISTSIPLQLKLTATFNFIYWLLFYNDLELNEMEMEEYFEIINKGLLSVLGKQLNSTTAQDASEKILTNLMSLKHLIFNEEYHIVLLVLELIIVTVIYMVKLKKCLIQECLKIVTAFIEYFGAAYSEIPENNLKSKSLCLFKFSFYENRISLPDFNVEVVNYLQILECTLQFLLGNFKESLKTLQKNMPKNKNSVWNYLVALNSSELENWNLCSQFLNKMSSLVVHKNFKARLHIMQGKIYSIRKRHKEALKEFENALSLSPNCPTIYYYMGHEFGKMGLIDSMVNNFEKLIQVIQLEDFEENFKPSFENTLLDFMHPPDEITETEAHYALAVSYGLNESFRSAAETFEKVLQFSDNYALDRRKRVIELPNRLTILHEAAVMNLMYGNLVRAEQIALEAADEYVAENVNPVNQDHRVSPLGRDIEWLQRVIHQDLLETDLEPKEHSKEIFYSEVLIFFFPQNVIGLLILAEIQRIQGIGEYKATLSNVFSTFSKYLASVQKKEILDDSEKQILTLVKALAGKTCVTIAAIQLNESRDSEVEKMFKRALSCNKGDRDALCNYYKFLLNNGRNREALKLWKTFFKEKVAIENDFLQSFSLKYLLCDKITTRELEKIEVEVEAMDIKFS